MDYIRFFAENETGAEMIQHIKSNRSLKFPIEGDFVQAAVENGLEDCLDFLLGTGEVLREGHMLTAITSNQTSMVKFLKSQGLSVNAFLEKLDDKGCTPLINSVKTASMDQLVPMMKVLLEHGADERVEDSEGNTIRRLLEKRDVCVEDYIQAEETLTSVENWREWKGFKEVCTSFRDCQDVKESSTRPAKRTRTESSLNTLVDNPDFVRVSVFVFSCETVKNEF